MKKKLLDIAHARSGDKGDTANITHRQASEVLSAARR
jgi:hypothetical protein